MYYTLLLGYILSTVASIARTEGEPSETFDTVSTPAPGGSFQCQRPGRFINPDDPSCRTYLTCVPDSDPDRGPFALRQDECGANALFSGRYQRCITGTDCATLEDFYAIEYECYECGKFVLPGSTDCRQFVNCLKTKDPGVFVPIRQSCPAGKLFSADAHACVLEEEYECGTEKPTTTPRMLSNVSPSAQVADASFGGGHLSDFVCLSPGRFPDESVPHCRGYRWCTGEHTADQPASGRLVSRNFLCESGQVFSEIEKRCVPTGSYQCPDDDVSADRFRCVAVGRFPDRSATGCERYYHCQRTATGTLKASLAQCPAGTVFSWLTTRCVPSAEYVCPVAAIGPDLAITGETVAVVLPALKQPDHRKGDTELGNNRTRSLHRNRCSSSGRFANDADAHCRTYFICTRDARGAWVRVLVRCPAGTLFSRTASRCVGSETVPQPFCSVGVPTTVPPVLLHLDEDSPENRDPGSDEDLECSEPDRLLPNPTDRTCRTYFGCRWDDAAEQNFRRLRLHLLQCPHGMVFSTGAARCVIARSRPVLEKHTANEDLFDDESSGAYSTYCAEPGSDDGSGESFDHSEQTSTSTIVPASTGPELAPTEQSTTPISTSTGKPTPSSAPDITERIAPQDGGSFSYSGPAPEYPCTATGRFADINSVDCRSYFLCKLQPPSGSFVSVHLTCPDGMVFSRNVNKCIVSNRHVC